MPFACVRGNCSARADIKDAGSMWSAKADIVMWMLKHAKTVFFVEMDIFLQRNPFLADCGARCLTLQRKRLICGFHNICPSTPSILACFFWNRMPGRWSFGKDFSKVGNRRLQTKGQRTNGYLTNCCVKHPRILESHRRFSDLCRWVHCTIGKSGILFLAKLS